MSFASTGATLVCVEIVIATLQRPIRRRQITLGLRGLRRVDSATRYGEGQMRDDHDSKTELKRHCAELTNLMMVLFLGHLLRHPCREEPEHKTRGSTDIDWGYRVEATSPVNRRCQCCCKFPSRDGGRCFAMPEPVGGKSGSVEVQEVNDGSKNRG